jgi:hypothetical protein
MEPETSLPKARLVQRSRYYAFAAANRPRRLHMHAQTQVTSTCLSYTLKMYTTTDTQYTNHFKIMPPNG